jgi:hypothetical protein
MNLPISVWRANLPHSHPHDPTSWRVAREPNLGRRISMIKTGPRTSVPLRKPIRPRRVQCVRSSDGQTTSRVVSLRSPAVPHADLCLPWGLTKRECHRWLSGVNSANSNCAASSGFTQRYSFIFAVGPLTAPSVLGLRQVHIAGAHPGGLEPFRVRPRAT